MHSRTVARLFFTACLLGTVSLLHATDEESVNQMGEMVVTATRTATPVREIGRSMTVITHQEIAESGLTYLIDLLRLTPGLDFYSSGPHANSATLRFRGLNGYHTKVLLNGIPIQDESAPQVQPTISDMMLDNIQRIEIIRGTSSTLYGSNAIGGVVNIITRKGKGQDQVASGRLGTEGGSHGRNRFYLTASGSKDKLDYSWSSSYFNESGISSRSGSPINDDNDAYRNQAHSGELGLQLAENLRLELFGRFSDSEEEYDNGSPAVPAWGIPATPDTGAIHLQYWSAGAKLAAIRLFDIWDTTFQYGINDTQRGFRDTTGWSAGAKFSGRTQLFSWQNSLHLNERNTLTFGYDRTKEQAETASVDADYTTDAFFVQHQTEPLDDLFLTGGVRYDDHSTFGGETTWTASAAYLIERTGTKLKLSAGKGYRAPSLYELYDPLYGNPDLGPETSNTWDAGFEQEAIGGKLRFGMTYFSTRVKDYINWVLTNPVLFTGSYMQVSGIKTQGVESFVEYTPMPALSLRATHTFQHTNDMDTESSPIAYRPRHKGSAEVVWRFLENRGVADLNALYSGTQNVSTWDPGPTHLDHYLLVNLSVSYKVTQNLRIFGRIENLLNQNYEVARNYGTYDRSFYGGLEWLFGVK